MHEVSLVLIKFLNFVFEIRRIDVNVHSTRDVAGREFLLGSNVQNDVFLVSPQFFEFRNSNRFHARARAWGAIGGIRFSEKGEKTAGSKCYDECSFGYHGY